MNPLLLLIAAQAPAPALEDFSFRDHRAGTVYDMEKLKRVKGCEPIGKDVLCTLPSSIVGTFAVVQYRFSRQHLSMLSVTGDRDSSVAVLNAFAERYGKPCDTGKESVSNRLGMKFDSTTVTWCFRTGKLTMHERGVRIDSYHAVYLDDEYPPEAETPRADF